MSFIKSNRVVLFGTVLLIIMLGLWVSSVRNFGMYAEFHTSKIDIHCLDRLNIDYKSSDESGKYTLVKMEDVDHVKTECAI